MSNLEVKLNSKVLGDLTRELTKKQHIEIGIFSGYHTPKTQKYKVRQRVEGNISNAEVGYEHETGDHLPKRSFLLFPLVFKGNELLMFFRDPVKHFKFIAEYGLSKWLAKLNKSCLGIIDSAFETGGFGFWKALSPLTVRLKGHAQILLETGQLRKSIKGFIRGTNG
jgi:hypothetical protein